MHRSDARALTMLLLEALNGALYGAEDLQLRLIGQRLARGAAGRASGHVYSLLRRASSTAVRRLQTPLAAAPPAASQQREASLAVLNGVIGDRLERGHNPLAIPMRLRHAGRALALDAPALAAALPGASSKIVVLVHGLCQSDLHWHRNGHDHGAALARDLGYTAIYLHYNSGRHISVNGREFARRLDELVGHWPVPVEQLVLVGYSMGGLVARSACYYGRRGRMKWLASLTDLVFIGTPHHGVPLERGGNWLADAFDRYALTAPMAHLARMRSAGITDLRHGSLVDDDWRAAGGALPRHVPLPRQVRCHTVAGTTGRRRGDLRDRWLGDGLVPLDSALGRHPDPRRALRFAASQAWVGFGVHHLDLLADAGVYAALKRWLSRPA